MTNEDKNEIIWRLRKETGLGLALIDNSLEAFIDALKRKPHKMDVGYDLDIKWVEYDLRKNYINKQT